MMASTQKTDLSKAFTHILAVEKDLPVLVGLAANMLKAMTKTAAKILHDLPGTPEAQVKAVIQVVPSALSHC